MVQYTDWGERAARWSGIRSETVDVHGTKVHYLVTDQTRTSEMPVHLLVPNPANSASNWLDVLAELRPHTHAIAVDLPGTIAGHTALPNRRAASIDSNVLFLRDFVDALELDRVVVHGWSAGGVIALLFADQAPERVAGLILVVPALPPPLSAREARMWQTLGRAGLAVVAPVALVLLRVSGRRILAAQLRVLDDPASIAGSKWNTGGDLTRMSHGNRRSHAGRDVGGRADAFGKRGHGICLADVADVRPAATRTRRDAPGRVANSSCLGRRGSPHCPLVDR